MSYTPFYCDQLRIAVSALTGSELKVLMYLASRADQNGTCFPSALTMSVEIGLHISTIYTALDALAECSWIIYHRKNEYDMLTGHKQPNVYQINPRLLMIRDECTEQARYLWHSVVGGDSLPRPTHDGSQESSIEGVSSPPYYNQQQEPTTSNQRQITNDRTNNNNQRATLKADEKIEKSQETQTPETSKQKSVGTTTKTKEQKQNTDDETQTPETTQRSTQQRSKKAGGSAAAASPKKYPDPPAVLEPLGNEAAEDLAQALREIGIALPLARGFIHEYGQEDVTKALNVANHGTWDNKPGAFRYVLQKKIADPVATKLITERRYSSGKYQEFIES